MVSPGGADSCTIAYVLDYSAFTRQVRDLLTHLDEPAHLRGHPLAAVLSPAGSPPLSPDRLRGLVLEVIESLQPPTTMVATSAPWREYQQLVLRYVEGHRAEDVARVLAVSDRQARRDHSLALGAVIDALWRRRPASSAEAPDDQPPTPDLDAELRFVGGVSSGEPTSVAEAVHSAFATVNSLLRGARVACSIDIPTDLPPVTISRSVLRQVLIHLLSFGSDQKPGTKIAIIASELAGVVLLRADYRGGGDGLSAKAAASDLRLVATERLVGMQGGTVERASPRGGELAVLLRLPGAPLATILVIDDNPDFIRLFRRYVRSLPYRIVEANLGSEALRLAREVRPAVITLDVMMAQQDGWEVLQQLKTDATTRDLPVVVCSVMPESSLARSLGAAEYLPKPVSQSDLLAMLARRCPR